MLLARVVLVVWRSVTAMILLIGLNPSGFPIGSGFLGSGSAHFSHGGEFHSIGTMFGFSSRHVVGNSNVDQLVTLEALILVYVTLFGHNINSIRYCTLLSVPA